MTANIHIGTSGFFYEHWNDVFYPPEVTHEERLSYYASFFSTVEMNTTFYHLPKSETVKNWVKKVPKEFIFSVKASRFITHQKRLLDFEESLIAFFDKIVLFKKKCGPILFQLPPSFARDDERLETFLAHLPKNYAYTFEFRHPSWETKKVYDLLEKYNIALCISDLNGRLSPLIVTSDLIYIRLHGPKKAYRDSYSAQKIKEWKIRLMEWSERGKEIFCYFDNDEKGYAIQDALRLKKALNLIEVYA